METRSKKEKRNNKILFIVSMIVLIIIIVLSLIIVTKTPRRSLDDAVLTESLNLLEIDEKNIASSDTRKVKSIDAAVPIFMYHFVREDTGDYDFPENMISPKSLEKQLEYLKDNDYQTIYKTDIGHLENFTKPVWLTFDDGWEDFYLNAFPLLKKYNMKASYYVITDLIGTPGYVKLDQLKEMKESGLIDIQSHTVTHQRLATLPKTEIIKELEDSQKYLKENLDIDSDVICYPYGSFNNTVLSLSEELGYKYGLAMDGGIYYTLKHKDLYSIPRIYANRSMTLNTFINYVKKSKVSVVWEK